MATFPCAVGSHRYLGPQQSAYLGIAHGGLSARSKLRLCSQHFQAIREFCDETLVLVAVGDTSYETEPNGSTDCYRHPDQLGEYRTYATLYPLKDEARCYYAALCQDDADAFRRVGQIELA